MALINVYSLPSSAGEDRVHGFAAKLTCVLIHMLSVLYRTPLQGEAGVGLLIAAREHSGGSQH